MIPKIIHYCWFGGNEKPEIIKKCIASWREKCPDYEIKEWNETNFDVSMNRYMKEAYDNEKWGFVPDFARVWIIYNYGGIYLDTDVELLSSLDGLLDNKLFAFFQNELNIALGLGFGAEKGHTVIKAVMNGYDDLSFIKKNGKLNLLPAPAINMKAIRKNVPSLRLDDTNQIINQNAFYSTGTYSKLMYHYGTATWTDKPNFSEERKPYKDTYIKRFLRKPTRVAWVEKHCGKRLYKAYVYFSYDVLEYGLSHAFGVIKKRIYK